ncbi:MAG: hypothetical protein ACOC9B_04930, partial [Chloroflexota bacterium]
MYGGFFSRALICIVVVASSLAVLAPASDVHAQIESLVWSTVRTPSDDDFVVVSPSEVNVLELGSSTTWYASDISNSVLYRSDDGGLSWQDDIRDNLLDADPAPTLPVWDIAVAPDDEDFLAVVT